MLKPCRECNKEFNACTGFSQGIPGMENWRSFLCSYDCAISYYEKIMASRNSPIQEPKVEVEEVVVAAQIEEPEIKPEMQEQENIPRRRKRY